MKAKKDRFDLGEVVKEAIKSLGEPVGERWWVEEYTPAYTDEYDRDMPESVYEKSEYFDSLEHAENFIRSNYVSVWGNKLRIRHQTCYERVERHWI